MRNKKEINTFIIYDVGQKRVPKVHKVLCSYMFWEQNSVFSGNISKGMLKKILYKLDVIIDTKCDCVYCYSLRYPYTLQVERWGKYSTRYSEIVRL
ncbi:CRISPR-associated protein Cas2 [Thermovirga lienii DSM 17291]|uniref:CRISPR-associated endoribonuclease Cas2 n=1 Tax=Thermovirga lienii (strain ATCC BAA-1197 / DSM 17291 / Cas60314) TaxID=580340 RepID=G7V6M9_THELD|nr:CRISPR-associated endonuclease Cas2 [Thermovirga lienii]AER65988.1 CRISPR-associated protein Cas2 [Thermovirga lienii DSM 17291]